MEPLTLKIILTVLFSIGIGSRIAFVDKPRPAYGFGTWFIAAFIDGLLLYLIWTVF